MKKTIGFSRLTRDEKIEFIARQHFSQPEEAIRLLQTYQHTDPEVQKRHDEFIENSLTNFYIPYGVAPNFLINGTNYTIPMVIEESSVVAAAAKSASFWFERGGFQAQVLSTRKIGHVHFLWNGNEIELRERMPGIDAQLRAEIQIDPVSSSGLTILARDFVNRVTAQNRWMEVRSIHGDEDAREIPPVIRERFFAVTGDVPNGSSMQVIVNDGYAELSLRCGSAIPDSVRDLQKTVQVINDPEITMFVHPQNQQEYILVLRREKLSR